MDDRTLPNEFPGDLAVNLKYTLNVADMTLDLEYEAKLVSGEATPINMTNHTYFNLNKTMDKKSISGTEVRLCSDKSLESKGMSVKNLNIQSESVYVESNGKRFAVIRCKGPDKLISVLVLGFAGNEVKRVMCLSETSDTIPISYGVCGEKIKEVFGVSMGQ